MPNRSTALPAPRRLTHAEVPDGTLALVFGDLHIGEHDAPATNLMVECADREGAGLVIANGDIANCATVSRHVETRERGLRKFGSLEGEVDSGREYLDWLGNRGGRSLLGVGNHEDWINDIALYSGLGPTLRVGAALGLDSGIEVLEHGYQLQIGSLNIEHGDIIFGRGSGPANLAGTILRRNPLKTTVVNHFHREDYAVATTPDSRGILRSHACYALGHMSDPTAHYHYAGRAPNWQQGFAMIKFHYVDNKVVFKVDQVQIHRDRRNRPYASYNGHLYR